MRHSTTQTAARAILALGLALAGCGGSTAPAPGPASQVEADVAYLASPALGGRAGSPGSANEALPSPERGMELWTGADDNASGTAAVLELVMIKFNMVGRLGKGELTIDLAANGQGFLGLLDSLATSGGILPRFTTSLSGRSDHGPFDEVMIPASPSLPDSTLTTTPPTTFRRGWMWRASSGSGTWSSAWSARRGRR